MFGQQNPFGLGRAGSGQQPNRPPNPRPGGPETASGSPVQGVFGQAAAARSTSSQQATDSPPADRQGTFGQAATFASPGRLAQFGGTFGAGSPRSTDAPVFGSNFHSPAMPTSSGSGAAATSSHSPAFRFSPGKSLQQGRPMPGFGQVPWLPPAPIFPAGASSSPAATASSLFGQRFGQSASATNIFGNVAKGPAVPKAAEAPQPRFSLLASHNSTAEPESTVVKSLMADPQKRAVPESLGRDQSKTNPPRPNAARKVTVQRKGPLFNRALVGVGKTEKTGRARLPSKDDKPKDPRARRSSERRGSVTDPVSLEKTRVSSQEIQQLTSIMCKGMPTHLNNKQALLRHFGKFGLVTRIYCNVPKNSAYVYFRDHDAAFNAKTSGTVIEPGSEPMLILWTKSVGSARPSKPDIPSATIESPNAAKSYADTSEVNEELASMGQIQPFESPKLLQRPKGSPKTRQAKHGTGEAAEMQQQQEVIRLHANTSEEHYRALDNRDKLLRQGVKKQSNLATAKATVGTCPDMCPEKERYMREHRCQLHPFEVKSDSDNKIPVADHRKIIKEYSRSSADQEEPLPHELRPADILSMTMGYLVCNIMDRHEQGESSAEEWYDFVWNRTRAIRKDITQQHLCEHAAVALVEKCARFHIHCAARLCEEDMSSFDQKINNENLTNCLQTLKYFYADMEAKGERCTAEAEFRAYEVLLNLNEGDILRQVQLLAPEVRESPLVLQALGFYAALNTNNYVRFFKLVRSTSYLNACILQRYFTQVRLKALYAIVRAYSPINHSGQFPVSKLVEILAFEDEGDARDFVQHYGLATDIFYVVLDRSGLSHPENPVPLHRSLKIIESKRRCLIGEVINNGPLPPNPLDYHVPHSSFDSQGTLSRESEETAKAQDAFQQPADSTTDSQAQAETEALMAAKHVEEERAIALNEVSLTVMWNTVDDVVADAVTRIRADILRLNEFERRLTLETCSTIIQAVCPQLMRQIAEQTLASEKLEELKARKRREEAELARQEHIRQFNAEYSEEIWENVLLDVVRVEAQALANQELNAVKEAARQLSIERGCEQLSWEYLEDHVVSSSRLICDNVYSELMEFRKRTLRRVAEKLGVWRSAAAFRKWRNFVARRKRTRRSMETFPSCNLRSAAKQSVGDKAMRVVSPLQIARDRKYLDRILSMSMLNCNIRESFGHMWIDVIGLAKKHAAFVRELAAPKRRPGVSLQNLYWSIFFSFPPLSQDAMGHMSSLVNWLNAKFVQPGSHPGSNTTEAVVLNSVLCDDSQNSAMQFTTTVCIKGAQGSLPSNDAAVSLLRGTQALLFVLQIPKSSNAYENQIYWTDERQRLNVILRVKPKNPAVPLLVIALGHEERPMDSEQVTEVLRMDDLLTSGLISTFSVVTFASSLDEPSSTQALTRGLQWAAQNCPPPPNLRIERFNEFMNKAVTKFYSSLVYKDLVKNRDAMQRHQPPDVLINAYNHAIEYAATTLSDETLMDVSWPQAEFSGSKSDLPKPNWNTAATLQELKRKALSCLLPKFSADVRTFADWAGLLKVAWHYVDQLQDAHWGSKMVLASSIQEVFQNSQARKRTADELPHESVAWTEVVEVLIDYSLQMPLDLQVVYCLDKMELFSESEQWQRATQRSAKPADVKPPTLPHQTTKRKTDLFADHSPKRKLTKDPFQSPSKSQELRQSYTELKRQLNIEKEKAKEFEAFLALALQDGGMQT